jgi:hypothetical protein
MKIFVFLCFAVGVVICEVSELECIESYLQKTTIDSFEDAIICDNKIRNYTTEFNKDFTLFLDPTINRTCAIVVLRDYKIADFYLKGLANHLNGFIDAKAFRENLFETKQDLSGLQGICMSDNQFKVFFKIVKDELRSRTKTDLHSNLCMQKYFVDHKIIDPAEFKIDDRSKYAANCDEIVKSLEENPFIDFGRELIFGLPGTEVSKCVKRKSSDEKWKARMEAFNYISTLDLSEAKREEVQVNHFEFIRLKSRAPFDCIQKYL